MLRNTCVDVEVQTEFAPALIDPALAAGVCVTLIEIMSTVKIIHARKTKFTRPLKKFRRPTAIERMLAR